MLFAKFCKKIQILLRSTKKMSSFFSNSIFIAKLCKKSPKIEKNDQILGLIFSQCVKIQKKCIIPIFYDLFSNFLDDISWNFQTYKNKEFPLNKRRVRDVIPESRLVTYCGDLEYDENCENFYAELERARIPKNETRVDKNGEAVPEPRIPPEVEANFARILAGKHDSLVESWKKKFYKNMHISSSLSLARLSSYYFLPSTYAIDHRRRSQSSVSRGKHYISARGIAFNPRPLLRSVREERKFWYQSCPG